MEDYVKKSMNPGVTVSKGRPRRVYIPINPGHFQVSGIMSIIIQP